MRRVRQAIAIFARAQLLFQGTSQAIPFATEMPKSKDVVVELPNSLRAGFSCSNTLVSVAMKVWLGAWVNRTWAVVGAPRPSGYRLSPVRRQGRGPLRRRSGPGDSDEGSALAGRALREAPLRWGVGGVGDATGLMWGVPRAAPLWIPASAGMTRRGVQEGRRVGEALRQAQGERTRLVPLGSCRRRNVEGRGWLRALGFY